MRVETVKCDECGAIKGESNHWLKIQVDPETGAVSVKHCVPMIGYQERDICGQACFHKYLDRILFGPLTVAQDS